MLHDTDQFLELLKPEYNDAVKYCRALCAKRSADDAEDILQQSLLKALENFKSLNDRSKFRSWLFTTITREFYNAVRKDFWKKFLPMSEEKSIQDIPEIYDREENSGRKEILYKALSKISSKEKTAILLFEIGGFSIEEIKGMQNENSISAIKSRLSRARKKLKEIIEADEKSFLKLKNKSSINIGDLENETIKLAREIRAE